MVNLNFDVEQLNVATLILIIIFIIAIAAVCSIARNTIECLSCPIRWAYSGVRCMKNCLCFLCYSDKYEIISVWGDADDGL